jgi:hypothetical protein
MISTRSGTLSPQLLKIYSGLDEKMQAALAEAQHEISNCMRGCKIDSLEIHFDKIKMSMKYE